MSIVLALAIMQVATFAISTQGQPLAKENLEELLAKIAVRHDCYFTIEKARERATAMYSLSTFENDVSSKFQISDSLISDLQRIAKNTAHLSFRFDKDNSKIIHAVDDRLSRSLDYPLEKKLNSFEFQGPLSELPDMIGKRGLRIKSKRSGDVRDLLVKDLSTLVDISSSSRTVRDILTESLTPAERGRILWIAESDLDADGFTYVWFWMGPKKN
jgi:hypothetical protein